MTSHDNEPQLPVSQQSECPRFLIDEGLLRRRKRLIICLTTFFLISWFVPKWFSVAVQWQARRQLAARETEKALWWLDLAASVVGTNSEECFLRARAQRKLGRLDLTKTLLAQAFELGYPRELLEREQWLSMAQAGELRQAEPHLVQLLTVPQGDTAEICEAFVNGFGANDRLDDALRVLDEWILEYGQDPFPHYLRGRIFRLQKRNVAATDEFHLAIRLKPNYPAVALELGEIYAERLDLEEALRYYQIARLGNSEINRSAYVGQAQCYRKLGQSEKPRQILRDVLAVEPNHIKALLELSHIELEEHQPEAAQQRLRQLYALQPLNLEVRNTLAQALQAMGKVEEALEHFKFVTEAQAALAYRKPELIRILRSRFSDFDAQYELGLIYLQYESEEKGLKLLIGILENAPNHRPTLEALVRYFDDKNPKSPQHRTMADQFRRKLALPSDSSLNGDDHQSTPERKK